MADLCQIFSDALESEGLTGAEVLHTQEAFCDEFHVKKEIGGEEMHKVCSITFREQEQWDGEPQSHIAYLAADVARQFKDTVMERGEWGENVVDIDLMEKNKATCVKCGATASLDDLRSGSIVMAEASVPQPVTNTYEDLPKHKRRFALLALLRDECEVYCSNSPYDERNQFHRKI